MKQTPPSDNFNEPENIEDSEWYVQKSEVYPTLMVKPRPGFVVCDIPRTKNMLKHAALLSTAPKLLKACKQMRAALTPLESSIDSFQINFGLIDEAIRLATTPPKLPPDTDLDIEWGSETSP